jgi:photosystem II stability/assembly factor-like uncharacterized protein
MKNIFLRFHSLLIIFLFSQAGIIAQKERPGNNVTAAKPGFSKLTTGVTGEITSLFAFSGQSVIAAGTNGTLIKTTDGGETWSLLNPGVSVDLRSISFPTPRIGYAAGRQQTILKTLDGGTTWSKIPFDGGPNNFYAVHFFNPTMGLAATGNGKIIRTINGAASWDTVYNNKEQFFTSFHFANENNGFATAGGGGRDDGYGLVLKTTDSGKTWTKLNLAVSVTLTAVVMTNANTVYTTGYDGLICRSKDGGITWSKFNIQGVRAFRDIIFTNDNDGYVTGDGGNLYHTSDGGNSWDKIILPVSTDLYTIQVKDGSIYIAGEAGVMLKN